MSERRDEYVLLPHRFIFSAQDIARGRQFTETISALHSTAIQLASRPETHPFYNLRLYPISLERSALLAQYAFEENHALESVQTAYEEERERVEEEWRKGRDRIRERLLEGIEERRRRAREEKEGEGTVNGIYFLSPVPMLQFSFAAPDAILDLQSRSHITRKLRNKVGSSPPPTPLPLRGENSANGVLGTTTPITTGPFINPHSLSVDELPSPFPFPLTAVTLTNPSSASGTVTGANGSRRRPKGAGLHQSMVGVGGLGKSLAMLGPCKEGDIEADLMEIRRGSKRRRAAAVSSGKVS